jgi:hypothetical protein
MALSRVALHVDQIWEGLFDQVIEDKSIRRFQYERINEQNGFRGRLIPGQELNFMMKNTGVFCLPSQAYLTIQAQVTDIQAGAAAHGANLAGAATTALQNSLPIFNVASYMINNMYVEQQPNYFGLLSHHRNLVDYSNDDQNSFQDEIWYRDTGAGLVDAAPTTVTVGGANFAAAVATSVVNNNFNKGYQQRAAIIAGSVPFTFRVPLWRMFDLLKKDVVYTGAEHRLQLMMTQNLNQLFIQANGDATVPQFEILNIYLMMPYVDPSDLVKAAIFEKMVKTKATMYPYEYSTIYQQPVATGVGSIQWQLQTTTEKPTKMILFAQTQAQYVNANRQTNVQTLSTLDVADAYVSFGGRNYPEIHYRPSDAAGYGSVETYAAYLQLTNRYFDTEGGASISYRDFKTLFNMLPFDLRYTGDESAFSAGQNSVLNINITLNTATAVPMYIWAVVYSDRTAQVSFADGKTLVAIK